VSIDCTGTDMPGAVGRCSYCDPSNGSFEDDINRCRTRALRVTTVEPRLTPV
jgi:hypothetical protein